MTVPGAPQGSGPSPGVYRIDPDASSVRFETRSMFGLVPVRGSFTLARGQITIAEPEADSSVDAVIKADSFDSGNPKRDTHVRSADFLDAGTHPEIHFLGRGIERSGEDVTVLGELTVRETTQPTELRLSSISTEGDRLTAHAAATIDRYAFEVTKAKGMTGRHLTIGLRIVASRG